ncbi:MAG: SPOR domain-containing protein [Rhodobacterales bacterium]|nr:SPOR domain-containing protein [Rhodobacterales bacterium]
MKRIALVAAAAALAPGCLPLPVTVASLALDGISLVTTQKTLTDHGLSAVAQEDCAMWRVLDGQDICQPEDAGTQLAAAPYQDPMEPHGPAVTAPASDPVVVAEAAPPPAEPRRLVPPSDKVAAQVAAAPREPLKPIIPVEPLPAPPVVQAEAPQAEVIQAEVIQVEVNQAEAPQVIEPQVAEPRVAEPRLYYVIASFARPANAARFAERHADLSARVAAVDVKGRTTHRVVVGPVAAETRAAVKGRLARAGLTGAWAARMTLPGEPAADAPALVAQVQ